MSPTKPMKYYKILLSDFNIKRKVARKEIAFIENQWDSSGIIEVKLFAENIQYLDIGREAWNMLGIDYKLKEFCHELTEHKVIIWPK